MKLLTPIGFEIREAENGQEALKQWEDWKPHLIWLDMRMPVLDGYETTRQIRTRESEKTYHQDEQQEVNAREPIIYDPFSITKIIALTASTFEEDRIAVLEAGCDDFVRKPFHESVIFEKMAKYLGVRYLYEQSVSLSSASSTEPVAAPSLQMSLAAMPTDWVMTLRQTALQLGGRQIFRLVEQIPATQSFLANSLTDLVNNFRFDKITDYANEILNQEG